MEKRGTDSQINPIRKRIIVCPEPTRRYDWTATPELRVRKRKNMAVIDQFQIAVKRLGLPQQQYGGTVEVLIPIRQRPHVNTRSC